VTGCAGTASRDRGSGRHLAVFLQNLGAQVASSSARPTKLSATSASPQSWTCSSVLGTAGAAAPV
jgi:hypothetical protein